MTNQSKPLPDAITMPHEASSDDRDGGVSSDQPRERHEGYSSLATPQSVPASDRFCFRILAAFSLTLAVDVVILLAYIFAKHPPSHTGTNSSGIQWLPLPSKDKTITKIAFGSCSSQYMTHPYLDTLVKFNPALVVLMGDNVYGDCHDEPCTDLQKAYSDWASHASFVGASKLLPVVATLDDHDYGQGDAWSANPHKDLAKEMFLDFFDIHDERRAREGVYQRFMFGPDGQRVQIILLDTRYSRSEFVATGSHSSPYIPDTEDMSKQMLSPAQWTWLEESLQEPAQVRLIGSSIQVLNSATGFECWRHIPNEKERLESLLEETSKNSVVVLLTGDRHVGGFYEYGNVKEVTASSWTHTIPFGAFDNCTNAQECDEEDPRRIGDFVRVNHFGMAEIDWEQRNVTLSLRRTEESPYYQYTHNTDHHKNNNAGDILQSRSYSIP
jgi:alkaline phosphatase D